MSIAITLLGTCEVTWQGKPIAFAANTARALLAYLATHADQPQRREHLAALLYPDQPQAMAFTNLRSTLARMRRALPEDGQSIEVTRHTVTFHCEGVEVDLLTFEALLAECSAHAHAAMASCPDCIQRLQAATALYRGDFLRGLWLSQSQPFEEWMLVRREQLQRRMLDALDTLASHAEGAAHFEQMAELARQQLAMDVLRESAHMQLMRALLSSGQRTTALAHYASCECTFREELGIEPGAALQALYEQAQANAALPLGPNPSNATQVAPPKHNLPEQLTEFVGRERELAEIIAHWHEPHPTERLLTITGHGGMGKTRLAIEGARACLEIFTDGVFFVSLAPLSIAGDIVPAIASALGLNLQGSDLKRTLIRNLQNKHILLILDNFEHVIDKAEIVSDLLQSVAGVHIIATSRERLNLQGERVFAIDGMAYSPQSTLADAQASSAVRLFVQTACRIEPTFVLSDATLPGALRICELVRGMPLGLELAAAWVGLMPLEEIATAIAADVDFLSVSWRDLPERQRSMRAVFDWTWKLLSDEERLIFGRLSIFRAGFTRESAQSVAQASPQGLMRLVQKSLVRKNATDRFEIHELLRQYAVERLQALPNEYTEVAARHSAFYLKFMAQQERQLAGQQPWQTATKIRTEIDNIRIAWEWASTQRRLDDLDSAAHALELFYIVMSSYAEGELAFNTAVGHIQAHMAQLDQMPGHEIELQRCKAVMSFLMAIQARFVTASGKHESAQQIAQQAIVYAQACGRTAAEASARIVIGSALNLRGQHRAARAYLEQARTLAQQFQRSHVGPKTSDLRAMQEVEWRTCIWLGTSGQTASNDTQTSHSYFVQSLQLAQTFQDKRLEFGSLINLANCARIAHHHEVARQDYEHVLRLARTLGYRWGEGTARLELGLVLCQQGQYSLTQVSVEHAQAIFRMIGDFGRLAMSLALLGRTHTYMGDYDRAAKWLAEFQELELGVKSPEQQVLGLLALALLHHFNGRHVQALTYAEQAWQTAESADERLQQAHAQTLLGHVHLGLQHLSEAKRAYEHSQHICAEIGDVYPAVEPQAGLAQLALLQGDIDLARSHVDAILPVLIEYPHASVDEPFFTYLVCCQVLSAANDSRAGSTLAMAKTVLQDYAENIHNVTLRHSFIHNVPIHRALERLCNLNAHANSGSD